MTPASNAARQDRDETPYADPRIDQGLTAAADPNAWVKWAFHMLTGALGLIALVTFARGRPEGLLLRGTLLLFPLPYFITHVSERYRFPIDSLLVFLNAWLVIVAWDWVLERARRVRVVAQVE